MGYQDHVSVVCFNVHSLLPKIDNLRPICASVCPTFVCVVETWLNSDDVRGKGVASPTHVDQGHNDNNACFRNITVT